MEKELRQLSKGMGANLEGETERRKTILLLEIERLDKKGRMEILGWENGSSDINWREI
jgi:hypothetical protein